MYKQIQTKTDICSTNSMNHTLNEWLVICKEISSTPDKLEEFQKLVFYVQTIVANQYLHRTHKNINA